MAFEITIDGAGRVIIPKPLREQLGLASGTSLSLTLDGTRMILQPALKRGRLKKKHGLWTWSAGAAAPFDLMDVLRKSRQTRAKTMQDA